MVLSSEFTVRPFQVRGTSSGFEDFVEGTVAARPPECEILGSGLCAANGSAPVRDRFRLGDRCGPATWLRVPQAGPLSETVSGWDTVVAQLHGSAYRRLGPLSEIVSGREMVVGPATWLGVPRAGPLSGTVSGWEIVVGPATWLRVPQAGPLSETVSGGRSLWAQLHLLRWSTRRAGSGGRPPINVER
jgi:hypothetical protein